MDITDETLSDGWETVDEDDSLSVASLSNSESNAADFSQLLQFMTIPSPNHVVHTSYQPPSEYPTSRNVPSRGSITEPGRNQDVEKCGIDLRDVVKPHNPRGPLKEKVISENELRAFLIMIASMKDSISSLLNLAHDFGQKESITFIEIIGRRLVCLEQILECAKSSHPRIGNKSTAIEFPIGFPERLKSLESEVHAMKQQWEAVLSYDYRGTLRNFLTDMDSFMTDIKGDDEDVLPRLWASLTPPEKNSAHIRRELHILRDQIVALLGEIYSCEHDGEFSHDQYKPGNILPLAISYENIRESIDIILSYVGAYCESYHKSCFSTADWMKFCTTSSLTPTEFCGMDPDAIRSVILGLKEVMDQLFVERRRVQTLRYANDPDGILRGVKMTINESTLKTLREKKQLLISLLQLRKCH
ncbi:hypothetical protein F5Y09DRAFT_320081 [Xylaria sp. FL1042]|nr:hypothetical protein F5Y09DRAFT_320081 [Xylaria sp. FL1042]